VRQPAESVEADPAAARSATAAALAATSSAIIEPWLGRVGKRTESRTYQEARATLTGLLEWIAERVSGHGSGLPPPERLASLVQIRRRQGADLAAIIEDVRALREAAWVGLTPAFRRGVLDPVAVGSWVTGAFDDLLTAVVLMVSEQETLSLREAAQTDSLTGLANHRQFFRRLDEEIRRAARIGYPVSLLLVDLDHFKRFNDAHGHPAGDQLLRQVSEILVTQRRSTDTCARYGGEEFAMIFPGTRLADVEAVAQNLAHRLRLGTGLTFSAGIAAFPEHAATAGELVEAADSALYRAKEEGRNRILVA